MRKNRLAWRSACAYLLVFLILAVWHVFDGGEQFYVVGLLTIPFQLVVLPFQKVLGTLPDLPMALNWALAAVVGFLQFWLIGYLISKWLK